MWNVIIIYTWEVYNVHIPAIYCLYITLLCYIETLQIMGHSYETFQTLNFTM